MDQNADPAKIPLLVESFWDRPPSENQGDQTGQSVYQAVGYALSRWEMMEEVFSDLYLVLVQTPKSSNNPVRRAFGSIESNSGRRNAINAAAEAHLGHHWTDNKIRSAFLRMTQAIGHASKRRDDIAHGIVLGQKLNEIHYGFFLFPPDYNTLRTAPHIDPASGDPLVHTMTKYRFTGAQVRDFADKFAQLQELIRSYLGLLNTPEAFVRWVKGVDLLGGKLHGR